MDPKKDAYPYIKGMSMQLPIYWQSKGTVFGTIFGNLAIVFLFKIAKHGPNNHFLLMASGHYHVESSPGRLHYGRVNVARRINPRA